MLEKLRQEAGICRLCGLAESRNLVVFGEGDPGSGLVLVGEAPGAREDICGRPFVGLAGQLLSQALEKAGIPREGVFITSVVKCRPPKNRLPNRPEVEACLPYLKRQLEIMKPGIIVCLGSLSTRALLDPGAKITGVRGEWFEVDGIKIMPVFHPAAILRNRHKMDEFVADLRRAGEAWKNGRMRSFLC